MKKTVYLSISIGRSEEDIDKLEELCADKGILTTKWHSYQVYDIEKLANSDCMILLPNNKGFDNYFSSITAGCRSEIKYAIENNIDIYLAYINREGSMKLYKTNIDPYRKFIAGIPATSRDVYRILSTRKLTNTIISYY